MHISANVVLNIHFVCCVISMGFHFINVVSENQGLACHIAAIFSQTVACKRLTETDWAD